MDYHEAANFLFDLRRFQAQTGDGVDRGPPRAPRRPARRWPFRSGRGFERQGQYGQDGGTDSPRSGTSVGLYTSPHFDDVRERIRVDGRKITETAMVEFVEEPYRRTSTERAAAGELADVLRGDDRDGLWYFAREDVDVAVLEVGHRRTIRRDERR